MKKPQKAQKAHIKEHRNILCFLCLLWPCLAEVKDAEEF